MPYRFLPDETTLESVQRVASEQLAKARRDLRNEDRHVAVHEVRKRCKKVRGLLRLVRPRMEETYSRENGAIRDAARELSELRDAATLVECFDALVERFDGALDASSHDALRGVLLERRAELADAADLEGRLARVDGALESVHRRVERWSLDKDATGPRAIEGGLAKTYGRAVAAMARAVAEPTAENLHDWRKRAKYNRYHVRLLASAWDAVLPALEAETGVLTGYLGDAHDLAVLRRRLVSERRFADLPVLSALLGLIDVRRAELRAWSLPLGAKLYGEDAARWARRVASYIDAWRDETELTRALAAPDSGPRTGP